MLDAVQDALDVAGLAPGAGILADLANAGISYVRGNYGDAAFSMAAAVPVLGTAAGAVKIAHKAGKVLRKGKQSVEGIYEFTAASGKTYVGQSKNIAARLKQHIKSGKLLPGTSVKVTKVPGGKTAREIAEHKRIRELTGGVPASRSSKVLNKVDPIGPKRRHLLND